MLVGFQGMTVAKDQELRNQLREAGVSLRSGEEHSGAQGCRRNGAGAGDGSVQRCDRGGAEQRRSGGSVESDFEVYESQSGHFYVQGRNRRRQGGGAERCGSDRQPAVEGRIDFEGYVPDQLPGAAAGDGDFGVPRNLAIVVKQIGEQKSAKVDLRLQI